MNDLEYILLLALWNLITFSMMGIDKHKAVKGKRRISIMML